MDLRNIQKKIAQSPLLSDVERTYWSETIVKLNPTAVARLERVLTEAAKLPWNQEIKDQNDKVRNESLSISQ